MKYTPLNIIMIIRIGQQKLSSTLEVAFSKVLILAMDTATAIT